MNNDIVARLRRDLASGLSASIGDTEEAAAEIERLRVIVHALEIDYGENADEIERLQAALEKIATHDMQAIAMDALRPGERLRCAPAQEPQP